MLGAHTKQAMIYLIDFGQAQTYQDHKTQQHISYWDNRPFVGMMSFTSIHSHLGIQSLHHNDIKYLAYVLIYLFCGTLPWDGLQHSHSQIINAKTMLYWLIIDSSSPSSIPQEFLVLLQYAHELSFTGKPDYDYLHTLFQSLFEESEYQFWSISV